MARAGKWRVYAQHECLLLVGPCHSGDYIIPAMNMSTCPKCGQPCGLLYRDTWARVVRRRVSDAVWLKPWTWLRWHWEYRQRGHLEEGGFNYRTAMRNARPDDADGKESGADPGSADKSRLSGATRSAAARSA